jgi:hypothetical protein
MKYNEENIIIYLCQKVEGIGEKTAIRIAGYMEDFANFYENTDRLSKFKTDKGKPVLTSNQITKIKNILKEYTLDKNKSINELWISTLIRDFVKNCIKELQNTTLENLLINPFLVKAFGFDDHKEVVTFYFYQKITRSIVTSWGFTVEGLLLCSGAVKSEITGFDMKVPRDNKAYHFQIKSSPNTMSIEQVRQLNTHIQNIKNKLNNIPMLGMTYGTRSQINSQIQSTLIGYPQSTMIGRELWDFIASEDGYCQKMLNWIDEIMNLEPTKFSEELEKKKRLLISDWEDKFGTGRSSIEKVLENYL